MNKEPGANSPTVHNHSPRVRYTSKGLTVRLLVCILAFGISLYSYIDKQNGLTQLRISIPSLRKEVRAIQEENTRLQYEIDQFENPQHLMELTRHGEFSHLKHPLVKDILTCQTGLAMQVQAVEDTALVATAKPKPTLALGAN